MAIALGVAVVLAVDLANASAAKSFSMAAKQISGQASHRIVTANGLLAERYYRQLRLAVSQNSLLVSVTLLPIVTGYVEAKTQSGRLFRVLGSDPLAQLNINTVTINTVTESASLFDQADLTELLTLPYAAILPRATGIEPTFEVVSGANAKPASLAVIKRVTDPRLDNLIFMDISNAQSVLAMQGFLSHIDVIIPEGAEQAAQVNALTEQLPVGLLIQDLATQNEALQNLTASFSLNLTAMSLLALLVGMFLIYNTMAFTVVQRRELIGILRALGVSRRELFCVILGEALLLGLIGTLLGVLLGLWLGINLVDLVLQTVSDLYYALTLKTVAITPFSVTKAVLLGLVATVFASWLPALAAARVPAGSLLSRAQLEANWRSLLPTFVVLAVIAAVIGSAVLWLSKGLAAGFIAIFLLVLGCALLVPGFVYIVVWLIGHYVRQPIFAMSLRAISRHLSRTGVAIAALMVAFSATVGVGIMVDSFRHGVTLWLEEQLSADFYLRPVKIGTANTLVQADVLEQLNELQQSELIRDFSTYRWQAIQVNNQPTTLMAIDLAAGAEQSYRLLAGDEEQTWTALRDHGAVIVSEPLAYRHQLQVGDTVQLATPEGQRAFDIAGIFLDYSSEHGRILIDSKTFQRYWKDANVYSIAIYGYDDLATLRQTLQRVLGQLQPLELRSNREIYQLTLTVFDRTFTITNVLRILAIAVAFLGMLGALLALQLERQREFAILRALGMTLNEIRQLLCLQTGFMGLLAGLLALPLGLLLAALLIFVINRRAFGWSLPFQVDVMLLLQCVALAVLAAIAAALYPVWQMRRTVIADSLRYE